MTRYIQEGSNLRGNNSDDNQWRICRKIEMA
jgi:hypothetical protein